MYWATFSVKLKIDITLTQDHCNKEHGVRKDHKNLARLPVQRTLQLLILHFRPFYLYI